MSEWLKWVLLGLLSIVLGVFVLGNAALATLAVTTMTGIMLLVTGGIEVVAGFSVEGTGAKIFAILMGLLIAFLGWTFLAHPLKGMISLTMLVMILLAATGIVRIIFSFRMLGTGFFAIMLISGVLSLILAGYIWTNFAVATMTLLGTLLGIEMIFNGAGLLTYGLFSKGEKSPA